MTQIRDTYPLSEFCQKTAEHIKRLEEGRVTYIVATRGHIWEEEIRRIKSGEEKGTTLEEADKELAEEFNISLGT